MRPSILQTCLEYEVAESTLVRLGGYLTVLLMSLPLIRPCQGTIVLYCTIIILFV